MDVSPLIGRLGRGLLAALALAGLLGCAWIQGAAPLVAAPTALPAAPTGPAFVVSSTPVDSPAAPAGAPVQPTYTLLPTYTPYPTYTALPTLEAFPMDTPLPSLAAPLITPVAAPTQAPPAYQPAPIEPWPGAGAGHCCTLRVYNHGSATYWIGTNPPYGGNTIKPMWYIEFYLPQPGPLKVSWCRYHSYWDRVDDWAACDHRTFSVEDGLNTVYIP